MFKELMPVIADRPLTIMVTNLTGGKIRVCVMPQAQDKDGKVNGKVGYQAQKEVEKIPDAAVKALTTPPALTGTAEELDAELPEKLTTYAEAHQRLQHESFLTLLCRIFMGDCCPLPEATIIHLVMDNLSSHTRKAVVTRYGEKKGTWLWDRFTVHYTPTHGSWLNQAEIEISLFSRQCLGRRRIPSLSDLCREARAWRQRMNRKRTTIDWQFTRKKAREKFGYKRNKITRSKT